MTRKSHAIAALTVNQTLVCLIAGWAVRCTRSHSPPLGDWRECGKRADREDRFRIASASNLERRTGAWTGALYRYGAIPLCESVVAIATTLLTPHTESVKSD